MPLDPDFIADCFYAPEGQLIDEILEVDKARSFIAARMPVSEALPITNTQRVHPVKHPRHVSGGLMIHATGMMGFAHAYYVLGLRHHDGWVGYGVRIKNARFLALADMAQPMRLECEAKHVRPGPEKFLVRYEFKFLQGDKLVYESEQTAFWTRTGGLA